MSPTDRATSLAARQRRVSPAKQAGVASGAPMAERMSSPRKGIAAATSAAQLDLAARLRSRQQDLRRRVEHRDTFVHLVRALGTTLAPAKIATLALDRAAEWLPASMWAVVARDESGQLSVLADRGLEARQFDA